MEPLTGALLAAAVAWASLLLAARVPLERVLDLRYVRWGGAASLLAAAGMLLALPVPAWAPGALLGSGLVLGVARGPRFKRVGSRA